MSRKTLAPAMSAAPLGLLLLVTLACTKYDPALDPQVAAHRGRLLLTQEPSGAVGILDARELLTAPAELVLVGRVGGVDQPWTPGRAAFVIVDPAADADDEHHAHGSHACGDDCPFCSKETGEPDATAIIRFVDERGELLPFDARTLFDLSSKQTVVVRGRGEVDSLGNLVVRADGVYVRR